MGFKTVLTLVLLFSLTAFFADAATIYGTVYDLSLDPVEGVLLRINSTPEQTYVSKTGEYSFAVSVGTYKITAAYYIGGVLEAGTTQEFNVEEEGSYILDMIIFPGFDEEEDLINDTNVNPIDIALNGETSIWVYVILLVLLFSIGLLIYLHLKNKNKKTPEIKGEEDDLTKRLVEFIKKNEGRATQKEIRKEIPLSEAKISLMISELEHKGVVEKIKKGRGNIIILKRKS